MRQRKEKKELVGKENWKEKIKKLVKNEMLGKRKLIVICIASMVLKLWRSLKGSNRQASSHSRHHNALCQSDTNVCVEHISKWMVVSSHLA